MKALVAIKRVLDYTIKPKVKSDGSGIDLSGAKMSMNPFDEIALEEMVRLKEQGHVSEIDVVTIGDKKCEDILRSALALGADKALRIHHEGPLEPHATAQVLSKLALERSPQIFAFGKQAIDDDASQIPQRVAGLLGWPQAMFLSKVEVKENTLEVLREVDGGLEAMKCQLPCVISSDLRLNTPRYAKIAQVMKARQKPIELIDLTHFEVDTTPLIQVLEITEPKVRKAGIQVDSVDMLMDKLTTEAKVLS